MDSIHRIGSGRSDDASGAARRRRRAAAAGVPQLGYLAVSLPPGSRRLGPVQPGDQGISASERAHAERAISRLFEAKGVDMVALYDQESNTYELRSRTGVIRWERWTTPTGELRYRVVHQAGENPIPNVDGTILRTIEQESGAASGIGKPVPKERNGYPDMLGRIAQLFDHARAPEFVYIPTPGGDPNHPGAGSHGIPDIVQSRAPLVISGPGVARGAVADGLVRHEDVAPTIADLLGVRPVNGTNASGVRRLQLLKWQDGASLTSSIADASRGLLGLHGAAERAIMFTIDGMSQTALLDEIQKGNLPNLARIMASGTIFRNGSIANYPTVTWANHNTLVTGASPGHHGLVNNSWWDRERQQEQLITDGGAGNAFRTDRFLNPAVETLYEAVKRSFDGALTLAVNQPSGRGAGISTLDLKGLPSIAANFVKIGINLLRNRSIVDKEHEAASKDWKKQTLQDNFATAIGQTYWS
ncbi:MAG: alkaline phosphatase family protein, partial [Gaiellales bacterium]